MTERLVEELSFEEYVKRNPMPTQRVEINNYRIVECYYEKELGE